ncbi:MAG: homocysteine S-methyltransferase family protein, partial [Clostridiales bacterium]|nr:homocysteine S-methyltransferase family protein [Clostridiales bacterium]
MTFKEYLDNNIVLLDGGMGTLLQSMGLKSGEGSEAWNITHPEEIIKVQKAYYDAGSNVVSTNTFGVNIFKYNESEVTQLIDAAFVCAEKARKLTTNKGEKFIAFDIGPTGRLLKPYGTMDFEEAVDSFKFGIKCALKHSPDLIFIET